MGWGVGVMLFKLCCISVVMTTRHATRVNKKGTGTGAHVMHGGGREGAAHGGGECPCSLESSWRLCKAFTAVDHYMPTSGTAHDKITWLHLKIVANHADLSRLHELWAGGGVHRQRDSGCEKEQQVEQTEKVTRKLVTYSCSRETSPLNACLSIDWISFLYK